MHAKDDCSPKPQLPLPSEYDPPPAPASRDLGPPPPGYGRYADFDPTNMRSGGGQSHGGSAGRGETGSFSGPRRNLDEVLCFKVRRLCWIYRVLVLMLVLVRREGTLCQSL